MLASNAFVQSDFLGKLIYLSLIALSMITWILFFYKLWLSKKVESFAEQCEHLFKQNKRSPLNIDLQNRNYQTGVVNPFLSLYQLMQQGAMSLLKKNKELKAHNSSQSTFLSSTDIEQLSSQVEMKIYAEKKFYEKYLFVFSTVFSLAPLLGLLGTVWGISVTLSQLPKAGNALSNDAVLSGLSMALGTTVFGIVVAIPALIFYNYFKSRTEGYTVRMNQFSSDLLHSVEIQYRAVDV